MSGITLKDVLEKLEKSLLNDYGKGVFYTPQEYQELLSKKKLDKAK